MSKGKHGYHQSGSNPKGHGSHHVTTAFHNAGKATHLQPTRVGAVAKNNPTGGIKKFGHNKETTDQAK